ncbi:MAG: MoaD/ThiS family protein [Ardenticatenaceae bacterium]|nr:MoaD/ThiS family protein [Ardenticatenaceae bacterium]HBY98670.1 molybdopterin synthase sulfur carrier subunit [Chloroflexota bacterium]
MPTIRIPVPLRQYTDGQGEVKVAGATAGAALEDLTTQYPDLRGYLYDDQDDFVTTAYESINVLLNAADLRELQGLDTPLNNTDRLMILRTWPATISGGQQWNQPVGAALPE